MRGCDPASTDSEELTSSIEAVGTRCIGTEVALTGSMVKDGPVLLPQHHV